MHYLTSFLLMLLVIGQPAAARDLVIFAAASLKEPLDQIAADFGGVTVSYGGSGALARQIGFGAPADIVLLANADWMDVLANDGAILPETQQDFVSNALVIVGQPDADPLELTPEAMVAALTDGPLAMGFTTSVPAGIYGQAALSSLGLWETVSPLVAEVDNVRAALALVARGEAPLGVVYQSDARVAPQLAVVARLAADTHPPIRYVGAVTAGATHPNAALFLKCLTNDAGQSIFVAAGFCPFDGGC
jgi:molybdate transport system substrate-binding protein